MNEIFRIVYACMRSVIRFMKIILRNWYLTVMIDKIYIDYDRDIDNDDDDDDINV